MAKLILKRNDAQIKEISLPQGESLTIGRKGDNGLVLDEPTVSGHHCRLIFKEGAYHVEDLASTNGTCVGGKKISKSRLQNGDVISVSQYALVFLDEGPPDQKKAAEPRQDMAAQILESGAMGSIKILKGTTIGEQYELKNLSTYIGQSDRVQIPVNSTGFFRKVPEVAAAVYRRAEGYVLVVMEPKSVSLNGTPLVGQAVLQEGDIIECGATTMQFSLASSPR